MSSASTILPHVLIPTDWLEKHLSAPNLAVVDIRGYVKTTDLGDGRQEAEYVGARDEYEAGHLPGAVFVDWTSDITDPDNPVKAQLAPPERFKAAMEARGIGDDTDVVIVDHTGGHFATRMWWALRFYGHDRAMVLDGGMAKWTAEGRPVTAEIDSVPIVTFTPESRPELRVEADEVLAASEEASALIIDARDPGQYTGATVRGPRGGHIPGAVNIPAKSLFNPDGTWKSRDELATVLEEGGVSSDTPVIAYCNGGVTATAVLFALHQTGHGDWANYDGSWNEWGDDPRFPTTSDRPE
jgi:thiosulfate/3-mercaptopyruvate sulfurtransferase